MKPLRALALSLSLLAAACGDGAPSTPCSPACRAGETCTFGVCTVACNPACGAGEQCVLSGSATSCVRLDGGARPDVTADAPATPDAPADAPADSPAPLDAAPDAPADAPAVDAPADTPAPDAAIDAPADAPADAPVDMPAPIDAPVDTPATMDAPDVFDAPVVVDAPRDTPDVMDAPSLPPCGDRGQPCCGVTGRSDVVCRNGLLCNAFQRGTCVDVTREPGECQPAAGCSGMNACGGPTGCGDRWCYRCQPRGTLAYDAVCNPDLGGADCASGVCQRGRCTYACSVGNAGDAECTRLAPGSRCIATVYGLDLDGGTPSRWATLGSCAPGCARASDCTGGRACIATANLAEDRIDFICATTTRTGGPGAACSSMGANTCQSGLCVSTAPPSGVCMAPCTADGDCTSGLTCQTVNLIRPVSGTSYPARGCLPR